jgi:hypothetical protein
MLSNIVVIEDRVCDKSGSKEQDKRIPGTEPFSIPQSRFDSCITLSLRNMIWQPKKKGYKKTHGG